MLFSEARSQKVMSASSATTVGKVKGFLVDPRAARVVALRIGKSKAGKYLHWSDVTGVGPDAVVVASEAVLVPQPHGRAAELAGKEHDLLGKRVLDDRGDAVGEVQDVDFDPDSGVVTRLLTSAAEVAGSRLLDCGSFALVVRADPEEREYPGATP